MQKKCLSHLSKIQKEELFEDFYCLNMKQLRALCEYFKVPKVGNKGFLIDLLKTYLLTGEIITPIPIPAVSRVQEGTDTRLHEEGYMLYGVYKNDLKTRLFMKSLVGEHFHYTAQGNEWMLKRWQEGNSPTYKEFAAWWQEAYEAPQPAPKKEWAYINFTRSYLNQFPDVSKEEILKQWKAYQANAADRVHDLLYTLKSR